MVSIACSDAVQTK